MVPADVGVKVTETTQLPMGSSAALQLLDCEKSVLLVPTTDTPEIAMATPPEFVSVIFCGLLLTPFDTVPKLRLLGFRLATGNELPIGLFMSDWI